MSRTITIPNNLKPSYEVKINNAVYSYPSGTQQTVPDEVAALIACNEAMKPKEAPATSEEDSVVNLPFHMATTTLDEASSTITFEHDLGSVPVFCLIFATEPNEIIGQITYKIVSVTDAASNNQNAVATGSTKALRNAYESSGATVVKDESQIKFTFGGSTYKFAASVEYTCIYW